MDLILSNFGKPAKIPEKIGKYELGARLGQGSYGSVYIATDENKNLYTLKTFNTSKSNATEIALNEIQILKYISYKNKNKDTNKDIDTDKNKNIDKNIYDNDVIDEIECAQHLICYRDSVFLNDSYSIITNYIKGKNLSEFVERYRPILNYDNKINITKQILSGLITLHTLGIAHRDIKLENIIYDQENKYITIIDMGFACFLEQGDYAFKKGTVGYMPPEFYIENDFIDYKAVDMYAFGIVIYELFADQYIVIQDGVNKFYKLSNESINKISNNHIIHLVNNCITDDPALRFTSSQALHYISNNN